MLGHPPQRRTSIALPLALTAVAVVLVAGLLVAGLLRGRPGPSAAPTAPAALVHSLPPAVASASLPPAAESASLPPPASPSPTASGSPTASPPPVRASVAVARLDERDPSGNWAVSVRYPRIVGAGGNGDRIDAQIKGQIQMQATAFEQGPAATRPASAGQPNRFEGDFGVALMTGRLVSLRIQTVQDVTSAAHPSASIQTLTFDLATGKEIGFADLFSDESLALQILSQQSRTQLATALGADYDADQVAFGTAPQPGNFSAWALTTSGLEITFGEYQVGPYAIGMPRIVVAWRALAAAVDPAGPAGPLVRAAP